MANFKQALKGLAARLRTYVPFTYRRKAAVRHVSKKEEIEKIRARAAQVHAEYLAETDPAKREELKENYDWLDKAITVVRNRPQEAHGRVEVKDAAVSSGKRESSRKSRVLAARRSSRKRTHQKAAVQQPAPTPSGGRSGLAPAPPLDDRVLAANKQVRCPRCGSPSITATKQGFGTGKGCLGFLLLGPLGLLCGGCGANKMFSVCLKCGHKWRLGK